MADRSNNEGDIRARIRPFVGGRAERDAEPRTYSYAPARPFSFTGASRKLTAQSATSSTSIATPQKSPTPLWTVAVYEPGLEQSAPRESARARGPMDDYVDASMALADDVREAQRHAASLAAAETLEVIARRLRRGEILLLPGASVHGDAAVVSSVLATLLGGRR
jgi:hypothetical protein